MLIFPHGICRICSCTDSNACITASGPCHWENDEHDLCSSCLSKMSADDLAKWNTNAMINIILDTFTDFLYFNRFRMPIISVTYNTTDFPKKYVGRLFDFDKATPYIVVRDDLEEIRNLMPSNFNRFNRNLRDDPLIVETWI